MSETSQFSIGSLGRRNPGLVEFEALLDQMPFAALFLDTGTLRILSANTKALELTKLIRGDLQGQPIAAIFSSADEILIDKRSFQEPNLLKLKRQTGARAEIQITPIPLAPKSKWILLRLDDPSLLKQQEAENRRKEKFWENLINLVNSSHQIVFQTALDFALHAGHDLIEAGILAVYQAENQSPGLQLCAHWGEAEILPEQLPSQDLIYLNKPTLWTSGRRKSTAIHRAAHSGQLTFLASAPLGQPNAWIGLIVVADSSAPAHPQTLQYLQVLAAVLTTILEQQVLTTELKRELLEQQRLIQLSEAIEDAVQEGLLVLLPDLRTIKLNPSAELILGYASNEVQGQPVQNILIGTETLLPTLMAAQQGDTSYNSGGVRLYRRHGDAFLANLRALPVFHEGELTGIIVLIQDLSEQEQIRERTQQLEQRAVLGEVTAIFAHEVRNPINNISTGLQLMALSVPENDPNQELINRLQQDCDRLAELMKSVLSFSRTADYDMGPVDLGQLVKRLLERLHPRMERVSVKYHFQVEPDCPPILGNSQALEQVFNNLVNNAVQAMSKTGGRLAVKIQRMETPQERQGISENQAYESRAYVEASIADTGPGIPNELQDRIFQPFFTTNRNGTGLGLAISKRIVTAHKGTLRLTSFPGGTVFHVQLPIATE